MPYANPETEESFIYYGFPQIKRLEETTMDNITRIALVTGANKGIGLEIARQLAQAGVSVIVGARDPGRASAAVAELSAAGLQAQSVPLDLCDHASIAEAAETIRTEHGRLDILVNNAGIIDGEDGTPANASLDAARRTLETNFIGTLAVTQAMLPLLLRAPAARIVNLSSSLGSLTLNGDPTSPYYSVQLIGYNASKAALNMLTVQLAEELRGTPHVINSVSPGYVKTDLTGHNGFITPEEGAKLPVHYALLGDDAVSGRFVSATGLTPW
jgi:NAD(P)-dependent dehydrogenase (short-subunit alcohol dehydrogenase family)